MKVNWRNIMVCVDIQIQAFKEINELLKANISAEEFKARVAGICSLYNGACDTLTIIEELEDGQ